jgi:hypothetical protein
MTDYRVSKGDVQEDQTTAAIEKSHRAVALEHISSMPLPLWLYRLVSRQQREPTWHSSSVNGRTVSHSRHLQQAR